MTCLLTSNGPSNVLQNDHASGLSSDDREICDACGPFFSNEIGSERKGCGGVCVYDLWNETEKSFCSDCVDDELVRPYSLQGSGQGWVRGEYPYD